MKYENAKNTFTLALLPEAEAQSLNAVYWKSQQFPDLAIVAHYQTKKDAENVPKTIHTVTHDNLVKWDVDAKRVGLDALENAMHIHPAKLSTMGQTLTDLGEDITIKPDEPKIYVLSVGTTDKAETANWGAAAAIYPDQMDKIADKVGTDQFFIIPSSKHEMLILPDDGGFAKEDLDAMVREVNADPVAMKPEDVLSNHAYYYDGTERIRNHAEGMEEDLEEDLGEER